MSIIIAFVTGGTRVLGKDMALSLSRKNINVIFTYESRREDAEKVVAEINENGRRIKASGSINL